MLASRAGVGYLSLASKVARTCGDPLSHALSIANGMRAQAQAEWNAAKEEFSAHEDLKYVQTHTNFFFFVLIGPHQSLYNNFGG
jgi:hypothetical protein